MKNFLESNPTINFLIEVLITFLIVSIICYIVTSLSQGTFDFRHFSKESRSVMCYTDVVITLIIIFISIMF